MVGYYIILVRNTCIKMPDIGETLYIMCIYLCGKLGFTNHSMLFGKNKKVTFVAERANGKSRRPILEAEQCMCKSYQPALYK